jgi:hypothetical protein
MLARGRTKKNAGVKGGKAFFDCSQKTLSPLQSSELIILEIEVVGDSK